MSAPFQLVVKIAAKDGIKRLVEVERPKLEPKAHITNHILVHNNHNVSRCFKNRYAAFQLITFFVLRCSIILHTCALNAFYSDH